MRPDGGVRTLRENLALDRYAEADAENIPGIHDLTQHYARAFGLTLLPQGVPATHSLYFLRKQRIVPDDQVDWPLELTVEERGLGFADLRRKYIDEAVQKAMAGGFTKRPVEAMMPWDGQTPGAWLRSRGASVAAAHLLALGFGTNVGSAASYLLHRPNSMGSPISYRIEGGNDLLPKAFSHRVEIRYGTPRRRSDAE